MTAHWERHELPVLPPADGAPLGRVQRRRLHRMLSGRELRRSQLQGVPPDQGQHGPGVGTCEQARGQLAQVRVVSRGQHIDQYDRSVGDTAHVPGEPTQPNPKDINMSRRGMPRAGFRGRTANIPRMHQDSKGQCSEGEVRGDLHEQQLPAAWWQWDWSGQDGHQLVSALKRDHDRAPMREETRCLPIPLCIRVQVYLHLGRFPLAQRTNTHPLTGAKKIRIDIHPCCCCRRSV